MIRGEKERKRKKDHNCDFSGFNFKRKFLVCRAAQFGQNIVIKDQHG